MELAKSCFSATEKSSGMRAREAEGGSEERVDIIISERSSGERAFAVC